MNWNRFCGFLPVCWPDELMLLLSSDDVQGLNPRIMLAVELHQSRLCVFEARWLGCIAVQTNCRSRL